MSLSSPSQFLHDDQKRMIGLFRQYEALLSRAPEMEPGIVKEILMEVEIRQAVEEQIFFPALISILPSPESAPIDASIEDHRDFECQIARIRSLRVQVPGGEDVIPAFRDEFADFLRDVEASIEREVAEVFPLERLLKRQDLPALAEKMRELRGDLLTQPQYRDAIPRAVEKPIYDYKQVPESEARAREPGKPAA